MTFLASYATTKQIQREGGVSYEEGAFCSARSGAYGSLADPDVEYYIVEDWGVWKPPGTYEMEGMANIDGASYELYKIEKQSEDIAGISKKITRYMSVRSPNSQRKSGTISVGDTLTIKED